MKNFLEKVDKVNEWVGRVIAFLVIPLVVVVAYEVVMRYVFNSPTLWSWEVARQLFSALILLGGGYTLLHRGHIGIDVLVERLSPHRRALVDLITSLILYFGIVVLIVWGGQKAWSSLLIMEVTSEAMAFPLYTIKVMLPLGAFLILLQAIAKSIRDFLTFTSRGGT